MFATWRDESWWYRCECVGTVTNLWFVDLGDDILCSTLITLSISPDPGWDGGSGTHDVDDDDVDFDSRMRVLKTEPCLQITTVKLTVWTVELVEEVKIVDDKNKENHFFKRNSKWKDWAREERLHLQDIATSSDICEGWESEQLGRWSGQTLHQERWSESGGGRVEQETDGGNNDRTLPSWEDERQVLQRQRERECH